MHVRIGRCRTRLWLAGLLLASGALAACDGSATAVETDQLEGRWDWRSASGGIAGRTITPASEGYTLQLRFRGDEAELWRNGGLENEATYRLAVGREDGSFPGKDVIRFTPPLFGWDEMAIQLSAEGELILASGCCDGFTYAFVRATAAGS